MSKIKQNKGITGIDIVISVIVITIFVALIASLVYKINFNGKKVERKNIALSYAINEVEKIKQQGYIADYDNVGLKQEEVLEKHSHDIQDQNGEFSGYYKEILVKDYIAFQGNEDKSPNILKKITVTISFKLGNEDVSMSISTYVVKE